MFYYVFSREVKLGEFLLHLEEKLKRCAGFFWCNKHSSQP